MDLTDKEFWINYWESKSNLIFKIPDNFILTELLDKIVKQYTIKNSLEVGGFPGHYSIVLRKKYGIDASLLDFVIVPKIIDNLLITNNLPPNNIHSIEANLFDYIPEKKYDLVFSNGLIEHFESTKNIIEKHLELLNKDGVLFITLPNFRGLNGWFQRKFDPENYAKHNISSMDIALLTQICEDFKLKNIRVNYYGRFMLWLENEEKKPFLVQIFKKITWLIFKITFKLIPIETKLFSPYIVLIAQK